MKLKLTVSLMIVALLVIGGVSTSASVPADGQINWHSYDEGLQKARRLGMDMVFYFHADWCTYCVRMQKETFAHASVIDFMNTRVIAVKVDVDKNKRIARSFGVRGLPATLLLTRNGDRVGPMPGFIPPKSYLSMLTKIMEQS